MKTVLCIVLCLIVNSALAEDVTYNCAVTHSESFPRGMENSVEGVKVKLDGPAATAILPISKRRVALRALTFQTDPENIRKYGEYQLSVTITEDKDNINLKDTYLSSGVAFVGLDPVIQMQTTEGLGPKSKSVYVHCTRE